MARVPETVLEMAQRTLEAALVMVVIPLLVLGPAMQARAMRAELEPVMQARAMVPELDGAGGGSGS